MNENSFLSGEHNLKLLSSVKIIIFLLINGVLFETVKVRKSSDLTIYKCCLLCSRLEIDTKRS